MLNRQICNFSLISFLVGVKRGDRIAIYMPMTPDIVVAMLACARIGAMHSIVVSFWSWRLLNSAEPCITTVIWCCRTQSCTPIG